MTFEIFEQKKLYTPSCIKGRAANFGAGQDGRQFFGVF